MTLESIWTKTLGGGVGGYVITAILLLMSLIQISPLKLNPWDSIFAWIGKKANGETQKKLEALEKQLREMWINQHRQCILTFARESRAGIDHSVDEWSTVLNLIADYEVFCSKNQVSNGIVRADAEYIQKLYQEISRKKTISGH